MGSEKKTPSEEITTKLDHYKATTVPVHIEVDVKHTVVALDEAEKILRQATAIALGDCDCRKKNGHCDHPVHNCIAVSHSQEQDREWWPSFQEVSVTEALKVLRESHDSGLVHLAYRKNDGEISEFCSCCSCCCWFLGTLKQYDYHHGVVESSHIARHLPDLCVACGLCVQKCPFDAWSDADDGGKPTLAADKCFGCGVCVTACPNQAIVFVTRDPKDESS
ncbi:4Fe-4S binding protein [Candidatus Bipolaricaulota bacterium]|nr:4Fe-4S binding protein [Candidatus Bipolaricaulota bacterium]